MRIDVPTGNKYMNEPGKLETPKSVTGPKGAVAMFHRSRDGQQIWVYPRRGESIEKAIQRVTARHGMKPEDVTKCS